MERIVFLADAKGIDTAALDFACYMTRLTGSKITGMFLHPKPVAPISEIPVRSEIFSCDNELEPAIAEPPSLQLEKNKSEFIAYCTNHGMKWVPDMVDVHSLEDIITETRFADLMIINADASFDPEPEITPGELVSSILHESECPVMIAPLTFENIEEIVFTYDGSASAVYAIKQFTHLFPQFEDKKVIFLEVNNTDSSEIQYSEKIGDYLKMHYSRIGYQVLHGNASDELFGYFISKKNVLVVIGAFGRSIISSFFRKSTAGLLLKTTSLPVFITHK